MQYTLIRARKRTLSLQINATGELIVRAPLLLPKFFIDQFVRAKSAWIAKRLDDLQKPRRRRIRHFSETQLKQYVEREIKKYSDLMGLKPADLRFTRVRSYWGTCAPSGILSFNLSLCFVPKEAVTYVVVHELAHLRYRGHGMRFWQLVNQTYPPAPAMRRLLRQHSRFTNTL